MELLKDGLGGQGCIQAVELEKGLPKVFWVRLDDDYKALEVCRHHGGKFGHKRERSELVDVFHLKRVE